MTAEQYQQFFLDADQDNSGSICLDELTGILRRNGYAGSDDEIRAFFEATDTSGDGQISFEEYMTAMGQVSPDRHKKATLLRVFRMFDLDGNGVIDKAELDKVFQELGKSLSEEEMEKIMSITDKDGSGTIDYNEFVANFT